MRRLFGFVLIAGVAAAVAASLPDLKRYLKIHAM